MDFPVPCDVGAAIQPSTRRKTGNRNAHATAGGRCCFIASKNGKRKNLPKRPERGKDGDGTSWQELRAARRRFLPPSAPVGVGNIFSRFCVCGRKPRRRKNCLKKIVLIPIFSKNCRRYEGNFLPLLFQQIVMACFARFGSSARQYRAER